MRGIKLNPTTRLRVLTEDQIDSIHEATLKILERTGIRFDSEDARKRLLNAGAAPHPSRRCVITFPRTMVEESIKKVTQHNVLYARDRSWDIQYDGYHMYPYAGGGDPKILDLETGLQRPSTYADVEMAARLGDALENNHFAASLVMATDVPHELLVLKTMEATMKNSVKAATGYAPNKESVDYLVKMWACVSGGIEELRRRPLFSLSGSPSSPLTFAENNCDVLLRSVEHGIPFTVVPCPICGETGPMTLGGSLAQQNAEQLGGVMLMQTVTTELPMVYAGRVCVMDPRSGKDLWGLPESALVSAALVQIAKRYRMVSDTSGMATDITRWDMQIGFEHMMTALLPSLAGADSIAGLGSGWEGASSLEMMVVNNEVFNDISKIIRGIQFGELDLEAELIDKVGHMGSFLAERHTIDTIRKEGVRISSLWDRRNSERAAKEGCVALQGRARDRVKELLTEHVPMPLDRDVERDVELVIKEASSNLTGKY